MVWSVPYAASLSSCIPRLGMCLCVASVLPPVTPVLFFLNLLLFTRWLAATGPSFAVVNSGNRLMHQQIGTCMHASVNRLMHAGISE